MYPLSDAKLEKVSNNEIIRRILELQNAIAIISDNMEVVKYRNKILDEENANLQNHIKSIVNEVKIEYSQNINKIKQTQSKYSPNHLTENKYTKPHGHTTSPHNNGINYAHNIQSQNNDENKLIHNNNMYGQSNQNRDDQNNIIDKKLSEYALNKLIPQEYTNDNEKSHCENNLENVNIKNNPSDPEIDLKDTNYIYDGTYNHNDKRDCENLQDFNNHSSKKNIYNLIMETEKINSIFSMASNVLNKSFFNTPKDYAAPKVKYPNITNKNHIKHYNISSSNLHKLADDLVNKTTSIDNKTHDHLSEKNNTIESYDQVDKEAINGMEKSILNVNLPPHVNKLSANEEENNNKNDTNEEEMNNKNDTNEEEMNNKNDKNEMIPNNKQNI
ncbi:conserved Plasmodium protein, unknown function [Plasmodium berghei]|uniref:Uncharacterized protein n=2 Tax=Plasmodium berghei TaxID=5821 RepID=A0A509AU55_PLABA|nr:conserved Plasmodium protein, unknown function [Plasmodium berghei ANKA]SCM26030.1 conserved Plasmodium protein, unknown function [Plasmodium berghei]SCN28242.1 conserved Plasmodium protein, unknown function [Plasmodium berghei]SCO63998.1 conserved Plasmodium protein, unknown function [Plasmodium berghei]VUC58131.1 conserved Plasmodium protein, unknown function [Plasmodium berghei ANKA]|eukprot:XP_034423894.1 conserved Plasmodium protein, unknown function [Plasmodium berghei ANKA]